MANHIQSKIFIGHGHSHLWRELKDFLVERLGLAWEEFNRESVAGRSTKERLEEMLRNVNFAFIVMTSEDEHPSGTLHARANVIHEAGLFQGRLGFEKAIILLEENCSEFSNIHGLTQIRFPQGNITACFEEIRRVLEREKVLRKAPGADVSSVQSSSQQEHRNTDSRLEAVAAVRAASVEKKILLPVTQESLAIRLDSGHDQGFLILVESHADQAFKILGVAAQFNGFQLGRINIPVAGETWDIPPKGRLQIRWANDIYPVRALLDAKGQYQGSFSAFIDFIFQCNVEGEHKTFHKRIKVQVDAMNRSLVQWGY
jgi:hypothetical protein